MLYYIFETEQIALDAENYISQLGGAPLTGVNALTGTHEPDKCKTIRWAIPQERLDGKWVFPYVGDDRISQFPQTILDYFSTNFPHGKEEYDNSWFPEIEEDE